MSETELPLSQPRTNFFKKFTDAGTDEGDYSYIITYMYVQVNQKFGNIGIANMHKKYRRKDRDPRWLG